MTATAASSTALITFSNVKQDELIHHRLLLIVGRAGTPERKIERITAYPDPPSGFPSIEWQVNQSHFKASVPLQEGDNVLRFVPHEAISDDDNTSQAKEEEAVELRVRYEAPDVPPLRLAILLAKDSPVDFDQPTRTKTPKTKPPITTHVPYPESTPLPAGAAAATQDEHEPPAQPATKAVETETGPRPLVDCPPGPIRDKLVAGGIKEIQRRVAIQAYCWQAFYAEQMHRHRFGRRAFRFEEKPVDRARDADVVRLEDLLEVHLLRSERTVAEFHDANNAQQNKNATNSGAMWDWTSDAIASHPTLSQSRSPIAVLTLESHWTPNHPAAPPPSRNQKRGLLLAHAALGGSASAPWLSILEARTGKKADADQYSLGVMGSHWLWAAPSSLSGLSAAFVDETKTDEDYVVSDLGEGGSAWETFCVGMGAWLHEAGHALSNPHWPSGIMARGYNEFSRIFMTTEAFRTRLNQPGERLITPANDDRNCHLHRAEACRARWHPNFRLAGDQPSPPPLDISSPDSVEAFRRWCSLPPVVYATPQGALFNAAEGNGIATIEIDIDDSLVRLIEFTGRPVGDGAKEGKQPVSEFLLDVDTVKETVKAHLAARSQSKEIKDDELTKARVTVRVVGTNLCITELSDYFQHGVASPVRIFAARGDLDDFEQQPSSPPPLEESIVALRAPGCGREVNLDEAEDQNAYRWITALPSAVGSQPGLTAITVHTTFAVVGIRLDYSDGTHQTLGHAPDDLPAETQAKTYLFQPPSQAGLARIVVRAGWWLDAVQFVLEDGKATELVGNTDGGNLHVLVPPRGRRIVGLHGGFDGWIRSLGICYDVPEQEGEEKEGGTMWPARTAARGHKGATSSATAGSESAESGGEEENNAGD